MVVDLLLVVYGLIGGFLGRFRKLSDEVYKSIRTTIASISGVSCFKLIGDYLSRMFDTFLSDFLGFIFGFILTILILRCFKKRIMRFVDERYEKAQQKRLAQIIEFCRYSVFGLIVIVMISVSNSGFMKSLITDHSLFCQATSRIISIFQ